jgi:hypothetical protein
MLINVSVTLGLAAGLVPHTLPGAYQALRTGPLASPSLLLAEAYFNNAHLLTI